MKSWQIALLVKPLVALGLFTAAAYVNYLFVKYVPDCWLKRLLTRPIGRSSWERPTRVSQELIRARR